MFSPEGILSFAKYLEKNREYYRAITEYERFLLYFPESKKLAQVKVGILRSYFMGRAYDKGAQRLLRFNTALDFSKFDKMYFTALFFYYGKKYEKAEYCYEKNIKLIEKEKINEIAYPISINQYRLLWVYLENNKLRKYQALLNKLNFENDKSESGIPQGKKHKFSYIFMQMKKDIHLIKNIQKPNRVFSSILSGIIPGLGHIYSGRWKDGLFSFLAVGMVGGLSYLAYSQGERELAYGLGSVTFLLYSANLYGGYMAPKRSFDLSYKNMIRKLKKKYYLEPHFHI